MKPQAIKPTPIHPHHQDPCEGGHVEIDFSIRWAPNIPKQNDAPASTREIIEAMNELRKLALEVPLGDPIYIKGRKEVIYAVAQEIEEREQGHCVTDWQSEPTFSSEKGIWESTLHVFPTEGSMHQWMEDF